MPPLVLIVDTDIERQKNKNITLTETGRELANQLISAVVS
jgi:hypothetical protein